MRKVVFPVDQRLDVYDFCSDQLREIIGQSRRKKIDEDDRIRDLKQSNKTIEETPNSTEDIEEKSDEAITNQTDSTNVQIPEHGYYNLIAVLTHQGPYADGGHYVGWCRKSKDE